jgi:hypothetical protein
MADAFEIGDAVGEIGLGIRYRLVVDEGPDFPDAVVEEKAGFQIANLLVEILGGVALDGRHQPPGCFR